MTAPSRGSSCKHPACPWTTPLYPTPPVSHHPFSASLEQQNFLKESSRVVALNRADVIPLGTLGSVWRPFGFLRRCVPIRERQKEIRHTRRRPCEDRGGAGRAVLGAEECQQPQKPKGPGRTLPWSLQKGCSPGSTWISDFCPPGLGDSNPAVSSHHGCGRLLGQPQETHPTGLQSILQSFCARSYEMSCLFIHLLM